MKISVFRKTIEEILLDCNLLVSHDTIPRFFTTDGQVISRALDDRKNYQCVVPILMLPDVMKYPFLASNNSANNYSNFHKYKVSGVTNDNVHLGVGLGLYFCDDSSVYCVHNDKLLCDFCEYPEGYRGSFNKVINKIDFICDGQAINKFKSHVLNRADKAISILDVVRPQSVDIFNKNFRMVLHCDTISSSDPLASMAQDIYLHLDKQGYCFSAYIDEYRIDKIDESISTVGSMTSNDERNIIETSTKYFEISFL